VKIGGWGLLFSLKTAVAGLQCSKQAETRLAGLRRAKARDSYRPSLSKSGKAARARCPRRRFLRKPSYTLEKLLRGMTRENVPQEVDWGEPRVNEA
jgi:hypothetical protein